MKKNSCHPPVDYTSSSPSPLPDSSLSWMIKWVKNLCIEAGMKRENELFVRKTNGLLSPQAVPCTSGSSLEGPWLITTTHKQFLLFCSCDRHPSTNLGYYRYSLLQEASHDLCWSNLCLNCQTHRRFEKTKVLYTFPTRLESNSLGERSKCICDSRAQTYGLVNARQALYLP